VNLIVPPRIYERDRLTVRSEPLVLVEGTLERHVAAGGAINVLVRRLVPLDASERVTERPDAAVKDFSPLDERERQRMLAEQPLVAAAGAGGGGTVRSAASTRTGALTAIASAAEGRADPAIGGAAPTGASAARAGTGAGRPPGARSPGTTGGAHDRKPAEAGEPSDAPPDGRLREHAGAEDFRAVAPPVMSFTQGRRR